MATPTPERIEVQTFANLYPGRFLDASCLDGKQVTLTISDVHKEVLEDEKGEKSEKVILEFAQQTKRVLVLNRSNGECIRQIVAALGYGEGRQLKDWISRRITFYPTTTRLGANPSVPCVRVSGSPELKGDLQIQLKLPKKKAVSMTLKATDGGAK